MKRGWINRMLIAALSALTLGCASWSENRSMGRAVPLPHVHQLKALANRVGQLVIVEGLAVNAKSGAAIVLEDQFPVYIDEHEEWPAGVTNTPVQITGKLVKHPGLHDPLVGGIQDDYYTLRSVDRNVASRAK